MTTSSAAKAALQRYLDMLNSSDLDGVVALFAEDVVWEDPYGSKALRGRAALRAEYGAVIKNTRMSLDTAIRGSHADRAAMAVTFETVWRGQAARGQSIVIITVDDQGLITHFQSYWAAEDVDGLDELAASRE